MKKYYLKVKQYDHYFIGKKTTTQSYVLLHYLDHLGEDYLQVIGAKNTPYSLKVELQREKVTGTYFIALQNSRKHLENFDLVIVLQRRPPKLRKTMNVSNKLHDNHSNDADNISL